jgi:hypothetical protein
VAEEKRASRIGMTDRNTGERFVWQKEILILTALLTEKIPGV